MTTLTAHTWVLAAFLGLGLIAASLLIPPPPGHAQPAAKPMPSALVCVEDAVPTRGDWGEWRRYVRGDTHGTRDMVVLAITLRPGQVPHPPHRHAEEEFMILADGGGTWHLDGKDHVARKGDVIYASPWTMHGLKNTSDVPLTYYMVKWNNAGVPAPKEPGQERRTEPKPPADDLSAIVGTWNAEDRHLAMGSLYQPHHATRQRHATVTFVKDGDRLTGYSVAPNHKDITGQESWKDGRTDFRSVRFADGKLVFEFAIDDVRHGWQNGVKSQASMRVEARLTNGRLVGTWNLIDGEGKELFRGEWEAERAKS